MIWTAVLTEDIASLPDGYNTNIVINGTTLSGGQKARVSLARALYDKSPLLVLDDVISGLDNDTAAAVFNRAFGPERLFRGRRATAFVCTHSMRHISQADHVVVLGPHVAVVEQGSCSSLMRSRDITAILGSSADQIDSGLDVAKDFSSIPETARPNTEDLITKALDDRSRQLGDWKIYKYYINSMKKVWLFMMVTGCIIFATGEQLPTVWVGLLAHDSLNQWNSFYLSTVLSAR